MKKINKQLIDKLVQDKMFMIPLLLATIFSVLALFLTCNEINIDKACIAMEKQDTEKAKEYIEKVNFIDEYGKKDETLLMAACRLGDIEMMKYLIDKGADVNATIPGRLTPLETYCRYSVESGKEGLDLLLQNGADQAKYQLKPPIFHLADSYTNKDTEKQNKINEMTMLLLEYKADLVFDGKTILHEITRNNVNSLFAQIARTKEGTALMNETNKDGLTPYELAVKCGAIEIQREIRKIEAEYVTILEEQNKQQTQESENETVDDIIDSLIEDNPDYSQDFEMDFETPNEQDKSNAGNIFGQN